MQALQSYSLSNFRYIRKPLDSQAAILSVLLLNTSLFSPLATSTYKETPQGPQSAYPRVKLVYWRGKTSSPGAA